MDFSIVRKQYNLRVSLLNKCNIVIMFEKRVGPKRRVRTGHGKPGKSWNL